MSRVDVLSTRTLQLSNISRTPFIFGICTVLLIAVRELMQDMIYWPNSFFLERRICRCGE